MNGCRVPDTELVLLAAEYVCVRVEAEIVATGPETGAAAVDQCQKQLTRYLHPLTGGDGGRGWEYGRQPHESDFYAILEAIRGLEYVRSLNIKMEEERPGLLQSGLFLICAGEHRIRLAMKS
jgi:hypothetical protein